VIKVVKIEEKIGALEIENEPYEIWYEFEGQWVNLFCSCGGWVEDYGQYVKCRGCGTELIKGEF